MAHKQKQQWLKVEEFMEFPGVASPRTPMSPTFKGQYRFVPAEGDATAFSDRQNAEYWRDRLQKEFPDVKWSTHRVPGPPYDQHYVVGRPT